MPPHRNRPGRPEPIELPSQGTQSPALLNHVRDVVRRATLPATVTTLDAHAGLGRRRFEAALATLEAKGEVQLNGRGDAVFAFHPNRPEAGNSNAPMAQGAA